VDRFWRARQSASEGGRDSRWRGRRFWGPPSGGLRDRQVSLPAEPWPLVWTALLAGGSERRRARKHPPHAEGATRRRRRSTTAGHDGLPAGAVPPILTSSALVKLLRGRPWSSADSVRTGLGAGRNEQSVPTRKQDRVVNVIRFRQSPHRVRIRRTSAKGDGSPAFAGQDAVGRPAPRGPPDVGISAGAALGFGGTSSAAIRHQGARVGVPVRSGRKL